MKDDNTTFKEIREEIEKFRSERDWHQFHTPKNLSMAISVESGELAEHFLWKDPEEVKNYLENENKFKEVKEELADVLIFSLIMAQELNIDTTQIIKEKIEENRKKYPKEKAKGSAKKYTEYGD